MKTVLRSFKRWAAAPCALITLLLLCGFVKATTWQGIEPFKSRRADVVKILGTPLNENSPGPLNFKVMGGTASISFVDANFVRAKHLRNDIEGTVLQIILQHENSSDTPESLGLSKNKSFTREDTKGAVIFRNLKDGVAYTFLNGKLKTTRYTFSEEQISRARH